LLNERSDINRSDQIVVVNRKSFSIQKVKVYYETTISMCCSNWQFGNVSLVALPVRRGGNGRGEENN